MKSTHDTQVGKGASLYCAGKVYERGPHGPLFARLEPYYEIVAPLHRRSCNSQNMQKVSEIIAI